MISRIIAIVIALGALGYLVLWFGRYRQGARARGLAGKAGKMTGDKWPPELAEQILEYGRLLEPQSEALERVCIGLAKRGAGDARARALFERCLAVRRVTPANAVVARRLAQLTAPAPATLARAAEAGNAAALLDRLAELKLATDGDLRLRAEFARHWIDVSPAAIAASVRAWRSLRGTPEAEPLTRFLYSCLAAAWDGGTPTRGYTTALGAAEETPTTPTRGYTTEAGAEVFRAMADLPPADLSIRQRAIQATFAQGDYLACSEQCERARDGFGAPALDDEIWRIWGQCIVRLEGGDWPAFGRRQFAHLPATASWRRLLEVLDRACEMEPDDEPLLYAQTWAYLGAEVPLGRALPVYERVLACRLPIAPALERLAAHRYGEQDWAGLEPVCRALLPLQEGEAAKRTARELAEALIEGGLSGDVEILERVFDQDQSYVELNGQLAGHYLAKPALAAEDRSRATRLMACPLPKAFKKTQVQGLREKLSLAWLDAGVDIPESVDRLVERYLAEGGAEPRLMQWAADNGLGDQSRQLAVLESLVRQRPVERRYCLALADQYALFGASDAQMAALAEAAEADWQGRPEFDEEDCHLATIVGERVRLSSGARRKLLVTLLHTRPEGWCGMALRHLGEALMAGEADGELLQLALSRLFKPGDHEPLHVWALELAAEGRDEPVADGLRLLALYDAGVGRPDEAAKTAKGKGEALAEKLAAGWPKCNAALRGQLFPPLLTRMRAKEAAELAPWEVDLFLAGLQEDRLGDAKELIHFAGQLATALAGRADPRAVRVQRWVYEQSKGAAADAAQLLAIAGPLEGIEGGDPFWFEVARQALAEPATAEQAGCFLAEELLARPQWDGGQIDAAALLLEGAHRAALGPAFVERVEYGRSRKLDHKLLDLLDEAPTLGRGRAELLLALAERREKRRDYDGALAACLLVEESVGGSEELARQILALLPNSSSRAGQAERLGEYLKRYRNTFDILAQMVMLARDPSRPLSFDLAYAIVDRWGDLAARQEAAHATDPSFVATTKCEVYDLYRERMTPQDAQVMLRSIGKHSRQALSDEARRRIEQIGEQVLSSSGQDHQTHQLVAELLYGLGNLPAATWQFEQLAEVSEQHQAAIESLERIARQLETPRREPAALLACYRCIAHDAHQAGRAEVAEATVKKAKTILVDEAMLEDLTEENRKRIDRQRDPILKLYQTILEPRPGGPKLSAEQTRDLADVYRLRGLWDRAGRLYSDLAMSLAKGGERAAAIEIADLVFDCYYKAGKAWWDPAARYLLRILWNRDTPPSLEVADEFGPRERRLMERVAVLYHSLCVDPHLHLDGATHTRYKRDALMLYERLPFDYVQERDYVRRLMFDLRQATPTILEPFEIVPHIQEHGRAEIWTGSRYEKQDRLGGGEFAEVFKVQDTQTGQVYAMKLITPAKGRDVRAVERFQREGAWLKEMDHPNIVKCYDAGVQEDRQFIIMDYVEGSTLDDLISRRRRDIPLPQRLRIFLSVCSAVEFLHCQGLLHRDLHPGNVLVGGKELGTVKLSDFGLATMMDREGVGKSSRIHGRENYTPPEVYAGRSETTASEVYSLGALLCFILSGWPRPDAALLRELKGADYLGLGEVIERALANEPALRYQRVTELIGAVRRLAKVPYDYGAILQRVTPLRFKQMFALGAEIGHGDAGTVYRARDLRAPGSPDVAVKEIVSDRVRGSLERRAEQFYRVRDLTHPNIVQLQAFFRVEAKLYIVMDLVEGRSLADLAEANEAQGKRFLPAECLRTIIDVARGLAFVQEQGIIHGCLVPTNVLVEEGSRRAKLGDFAASVLFEGDQWHKSAQIRQYNYYLAPEIAHNEAATPASDVYSLGWLLCQMITGQRGQLSSGEVLAGLEEMEGWSEAQMERLLEIVEGCTALDPARRAYRDGAEVLGALEGV